MLALVTAGNPEVRTLKDCAEIANQRVLPSGLNLERVLSATKSLPGEPKTVFEQWLDTFKECITVGDERVFLRTEIENRTRELAIAITTADGKLRNGLFEGIGIRIEAAAEEKISFNGKEYYKVGILRDSIVKFMRTVDEQVQYMKQNTINTLFDNTSVDINSGALITSGTLFSFNGEIFDRAQLEFDIATTAVKKALDLAKTKGARGLGIMDLHKTSTKGVLDSTFLAIEKNCMPKLEDFMIAPPSTALMLKDSSAK